MNSMLGTCLVLLWGNELASVLGIYTPTELAVRMAYGHEGMAERCEPHTVLHTPRSRPTGRIAEELSARGWSAVA